MWIRKRNRWRCASNICEINWRMQLQTGRNQWVDFNHNYDIYKINMLCNMILMIINILFIFCFTLLFLELSFYIFFFAFLYILVGVNQEVKAA